MQTKNVNLENSMTISYNGDLRRTLQSDYLDFYHSHGFHNFLLLFYAFVFSHNYYNRNYYS